MSKTENHEKVAHQQRNKQNPSLNMKQRKAHYTAEGY